MALAFRDIAYRPPFPPSFKQLVHLISTSVGSLLFPKDVLVIIVEYARYNPGPSTNHIVDSTVMDRIAKENDDQLEVFEVYGCGISMEPDVVNLVIRMNEDLLAIEVDASGETTYCELGTCPGAVVDRNLSTWGIWTPAHSSSTFIKDTICFCVVEDSRTRHVNLWSFDQQKQIPVCTFGKNDSVSVFNMLVSDDGQTMTVGFIEKSQGPLPRMMMNLWKLNTSDWKRQYVMTTPNRGYAYYRSMIWARGPNVPINTHVWYQSGVYRLTLMECRTGNYEEFDLVPYDPYGYGVYVCTETGMIIFVSHRWSIGRCHCIQSVCTSHCAKGDEWIVCTLNPWNRHVQRLTTFDNTNDEYEDFLLKMWIQTSDRRLYLLFQHTGLQFIPLPDEFFLAF